MAFLVQDDDGSIDNANSHVTVQEFYDYMTDRGEDYTNLTTYPTVKIQAAAIKATDHINTLYKYVGSQTNSDQGTAFPRDGVYKYNYLYAQDLIYTTDYDVIDYIPNEVKYDTFQYMKYLLDNDGEDLYDNIDPESSGVKSYRDSVTTGLYEEKEYFGSVKYNSKVIGLAVNIIRSGYLVALTGNRMYI